jgi:hypothetical protein
VMEFAAPKQRRAVYAYRDRSPSTGALIESLAAAQGEFAPVIKDQTGQYGPFASMAALRRATIPALSKHGLAVTMECADTDDAPYLVCVLSHRSDQFISSTFRLERIPDPQKRSAYLTYMKRAAYSAMLCLAAEEDDDGETAAAAETESQAKGRGEQVRLARDAIRSAATLERLAAVADRVAERVKSGDLDEASRKQLTQLITARQQALQQAKSESRVQGAKA